ncbi:MAG: hypothetical protein ABIK89_24290 [Planctomycetota bacterium]
MPALRFSPYAWAKLLYLRDRGDSEVGGFGIAAADDFLLVEDVRLVRQVSTGVSVALDDEAVADFFDQQVDRGLLPVQFARIWVHTHPGTWPQPSLTDEETFHKVFGRTDWAVMFILARGGQSYARLRFHVGPGADIELPVGVDYGRTFAASDPEAWSAEYEASVREPILREPILSVSRHFGEGTDAGDFDMPMRSAVESLWLEDGRDPFGDLCGVEGLDHDDRA